jgi:hypothetical protein
MIRGLTVCCCTIYKLPAYFVFGKPLDFQMNVLMDKFLRKGCLDFRILPKQEYL